MVTARAHSQRRCSCVGPTVDLSQSLESVHRIGLALGLVAGERPSLLSIQMIVDNRVADGLLQTLERADDQRAVRPRTGQRDCNTEQRQGNPQWCQLTLISTLSPHTVQQSALMPVPCPCTPLHATEICPAQDRPALRVLSLCALTVEMVSSCFRRELSICSDPVAKFRLLALVLT